MSKILSIGLIVGPAVRIEKMLPGNPCMCVFLNDGGAVYLHGTPHEMRSLADAIHAALPDADQASASLPTLTGGHTGSGSASVNLRDCDPCDEAGDVFDMAVAKSARQEVAA